MCGACVWLVRVVFVCGCLLCIEVCVCCVCLCCVVGLCFVCVCVCINDVKYVGVGVCSG